MADRQVIEIPYTPRSFQRVIHDGMDTHRFGVVVTHRRFGKSVCAVNHLQRAAVRCKKPRPRFGYIGPTYRQAKATVWDYMKFYARPIPGIDVHESELRITYPGESQVRIFGGDNPDSLRGLYFDGVVVDEFGLHAPNILSEVILPTLADRGGWLLLLGTPNGKNQFYDAVQEAIAHPKKWFYANYPVSQTHILSADELAIAREGMTADEYQQEYECSFEAAVKGAVYSDELRVAREEGRIGAVPHLPEYRVETDWDLGYVDAMAIWFVQRETGGPVRLINYYEANLQGFPHFADVLSDYAKRYHYSYGAHWAPHDIELTELGSGRTRRAIAADLGIHFQVHPRVGNDERTHVEEGISVARTFFPRCWFDAEKCRKGLEALQHYRYRYNTSIHEMTGKPVHDWSSHAADAFRGLATRYYRPKANKVRPESPYDHDPADRRFYPVRTRRGGY